MNTTRSSSFFSMFPHFCLFVAQLLLGARKFGHFQELCHKRLRSSQLHRGPTSVSFCYFLLNFRKAPIPIHVHPASHRTRDHFVSGLLQLSHAPLSNYNNACYLYIFYWYCMCYYGLAANFFNILLLGYQTTPCSCVCFFFLHIHTGSAYFSK